MATCMSTESTVPEDDQEDIFCGFFSWEDSEMASCFVCMYFVGW